MSEESMGGEATYHGPTAAHPDAKSDQAIKDETAYSGRGPVGMVCSWLARTKLHEAQRLRRKSQEYLARADMLEGEARELMSL